MKANEYQLLANRTAAGDPVTLTPEQVELLNWTTGLTGEAGEVSDHIKKGIFHGQGIDQNHIRRELGDVLWYIAAFCHTCDFTLEDIMAENIEKLKKRFPDGFSFERSTFREEADFSSINFPAGWGSTGDKVVLVDEATVSGSEWESCKEMGQPYLFIVGKENSSYRLAHVWDDDYRGYDLYPREAIAAYEEPADQQLTGVMRPTLQTVPDDMGQPSRSLQARVALTKESLERKQTWFHIIGQDSKEYPARITEQYTCATTFKQKVIIERNGKIDYDTEEHVTYQDTLDLDAILNNPTFAYYGR